MLTTEEQQYFEKAQEQYRQLVYEKYAFNMQIVGGYGMTNPGLHKTYSTRL